MLLKVLVIGTGSVGLRHIANLVELGCRVYAFSYRGQSGVNRHLDVFPESVELVDSIEDSVLSVFDAVVIANSTHLHIECALRCARLNKPFFIEKPLSHNMKGVDELRSLVQGNKCIVEAGYMMRCHPNLQWIKALLSEKYIGDIAYIRCAVGQWLPDWRPDSDYRKSYSAKRDSGGGVIFDLIHELDLIQWLGGAVSEINAMVAHWENLDIETEAIAQIGIRTSNNILGQIHLDYVHPTYHRDFEIVGAKGAIYWDYTKNEACCIMRNSDEDCQNTLPETFKRNDMFLSHMHHFLMRVQNHAIPPISSLEDSIHALKVALAAHDAASSGCTQLL